MSRWLLRTSRSSPSRRSRTWRRSWLFVAKDSPASADRVISEIYAAIHELAEMPGMGHLREDLIDEPLRFWSVHQWLVIYRPETQPIEVVRVLSGYRDIAQLLRQQPR